MTAVEWLVKQLESEYNSFPLLNAEACIEAKEMEKEQIIESYCQGCLDITQDEEIFPRETAQDYYNETFKNTKE